MQRFRFTLIAVCAVLLVLGGLDIRLQLTNPEPASVAVESAAKGEIPREWMTIEGGYLAIPEAISTSGSIEIDALLVPLKRQAGDTVTAILVETRSPDVLGPFKELNFGFDSVVARERYLQEKKDLLYPKRPVTGLQITGLVAEGNRDKLMTLAKEVQMPLAPEVLFLAEGKEPERVRGWFYVLVAIGGLLKIASAMRRTARGAVASSGE